MDVCQTSSEWSKGISTLHYTLENKVSFVAMIDPWRTFNIQGTCTLHKSFLKLEKVSLDLNVHNT